MGGGGGGGGVGGGGEEEEEELEEEGRRLSCHVSLLPHVSVANWHLLQPKIHETFVCDVQNILCHGDENINLVAFIILR